MSRPALPEERGADLRRDPPTLDELRAKHDFKAEDRDLYESGDGLRTVDTCRSCGYTQEARDRGNAPECPDESIPPRWIETAERYDLIPQGEIAPVQSHGKREVR